jgi:hypothetical protein
MESLPTFTGWNPSTSFSGLIHVLREGHLDEDAVDAWVSVQLVDDRHQLGFGRCRGQPYGLAVHPERLAGLFLGADIDRAGGIVADEDDRQSRGDAARLERVDAL